MNLEQLLSYLNQNITFYCVFPCMVMLGLFLSIRLRFLQVTQLKKSFSSLLSSEKKGSGSISGYQAVATVIAGNLGTGNISGIAVALATGGPGSLVWMWIMAFLGSIIQYSSCVLGMKYRIKNAEGEYVGGPMYYLKHGLGMKKLAGGFAVFTLVAALAVGNFAQVNSMVLPLKEIGFSPLLCGFILAVGAALVMLGGVQRIALVAASIVPVIALVYIGAGCFILGCYRESLWPAVNLMFTCAFSGSALVGGILGFGVLKALSTGFERGIFATDAGTGIVPILQAGARTRNPVMNGVIALLPPFLVMLICSMTGLILLVTGAAMESGLESTNMVVFAFQKVFGDSLGLTIVMVSLVLFAYTTVIAWGGCADKAAEFLWDKKKARIFQIVYLSLIPVGAVASVGLVWVFADLSISCMLLANLIGIVGLSKEVIVETRLFFQKHKEQKNITN